MSRRRSFDFRMLPSMEKGPADDATLARVETIDRIAALGYDCLTFPLFSSFYTSDHTI